MLDKDFRDNVTLVDGIFKSQKFNYCNFPILFQHSRKLLGTPLKNFLQAYRMHHLFLNRRYFSRCGEKVKHFVVKHYYKTLIFRFIPPKLLC